MRQNRDRWLELLISPTIEAGYSNLGWDPETNHGITKAVYEDWVGHPVTTGDMKSLTPDIARDIAVAKYWNVIKGDELPGGLDIYLADFAFNSGPPKAVETLQEIVGVEIDGVVGEKTLAAVRAWSDTRALIENLHAKRMAFLRSLSKWEKAGDGWTNRCNRMRSLALSLVQPNAIEAKVPSAAGKGAAIAAIAAAIAAALPAILDQATKAHDAAAGGDWAALATAIAMAVGGVIGGWTHYRKWRAAR